ncbi:MAG: hypothetical protein JWR09_2682 [Mucilaginibacter sp.]|nr:hypothetical protein [Mucilaginibacter sp.]
MFQKNGLGSVVVICVSEYPDQVTGVENMANLKNHYQSFLLS